jgi:hypothetical protein
MKKKRKEHLAKPMDAYEKKKIIKCVDDPDTAFRCEAARDRSRYYSAAEITREFELIHGFRIDDDAPTY